MQCPENKKPVIACRPNTYKKKGKTYKEDETSESFSNDKQKIRQTHIKEKGDYNDIASKLILYTGFQPGHKQYIIKEMILPKSNNNAETNAIFNILEAEYKTCEYIESMRRKSSKNKIIMHGIIRTYFSSKQKTYFDNNSDPKKYRLQQHHGGVTTLKEFLIGLKRETRTFRNNHREFVRYFILFQCLCIVKSLHYLKIVHNDLHFDNILITQRMNSNKLVKQITLLIPQLLAVRGDYFSTMSILYTKSPFVIYIFDFDRATNFSSKKLQEDTNNIVQRNLLIIDHGMTNWQLSTQKFLPMNDFLTLSSMFARYVNLDWYDRIKQLHDGPLRNSLFGWNDFIRYQTKDIDIPLPTEKEFIDELYSKLERSAQEFAAIV